MESTMTTLVELKAAFETFARTKGRTEAYVLLGRIAGADSIENAPEDSWGKLHAAFTADIMGDLPSDARNAAPGQVRKPMTPAVYEEAFNGMNHKAFRKWNSPSRRRNG